MSQTASKEFGSLSPGHVRALLVVSIISANLTGAALVSIYFMVIEPTTVVVSMQQELIRIMLITSGLVLLGTTATMSWLRRQAGVYQALYNGQQPEAALLARAQRDVLNAPLVFSLISMGVWVVAAVVMGFYTYANMDGVMQPTQGLLQAFRVLSGTLAAGVATATIIFFASEQVVRKMRPLFFPQGGLVNTKGVYRLRLRRRLLFSFFMAGLGPMIMLAMITYRVTHITMKEDPSVAVEDLMRVIFYLLAVCALAAVVLSRLVSSSVSRAVVRLERAMEKVRKGDLKAKVPVSDNDELGVLADDFNNMVDGLAERERIKDTFGRFVTPAIASAILQAPPSPGGESTEVSVLFSDIRGYTKLSEQMPPDEVIGFLNAYFAYMVPAIEKHQGLVYQFVGDAIMAVFGAPVKLADHATHAVRAGLAMLEALEEFNRRERPGHKPVGMGIGIHSGPVVAGIIGSDDRMEYRVVGDTVNLTSRVEGLTKPLDARLLISQSTKELLTSPFQLKELGSHQVKGKERPVSVYQVL